MKIAIDLASICWTCLRAGVDADGKKLEGTDGKMYQVNTAEYGYKNAVNSIKFSLDSHKLTPIDMILIPEGMNAKAPRLMIYKDYKSGSSGKPLEMYEQYEKLKNMLLDVFRRLGAIQLHQDNVESDDVIAWLAVNTKEDLVIRSGDQDLSVLSGVNDHGAKIITHIGKEVDTNVYGMFPLKYVTLYKSLVGDPSDKIKGVFGFGKEKWAEFHARFGEEGMEELCRLANMGSLRELESEAEQDKLIKLIWDGRDQFLQSWKLASLHPEWVDTMSNAPEWKPGMVAGEITDDRLKHWRGRARLVELQNWDSFLPWFREHMCKREYIGLDFETSTPAESDEWLAAQGDPGGVDVMGSELSGMSLTFGTNMEFTVYIPVDHTDTDNVPLDKVQGLLEEIAAAKLELIIQNTSFEGTVAFNHFGDKWADNGYGGFLPNWRDTKFEASYVDENFSLGLKKLSKRWLDYDQVDYKTVTTIDGVQYKMRELPARHVFDYATDDTITTVALHNFFKLFMQLEDTYHVYENVELKASYLHCESFVKGTRISLSTLRELQVEDEKSAAEAWITVRAYLLANGWEGTVTPVFAEALTPAQFKEVHEIVTGEALNTKVRLPDKLLAAVDSKHALLREAYTRTGNGDFSLLNELVAKNFKGEPVFNMGSTDQKQKLLYEVMGLPIRIRNKPTDAMKAAGEKVGSPKTDALAVLYACLDATPEVKLVLEAMRIMQMVSTRNSLYYNTYGGFVHWKTGRIHSSHNQCATNTRRASSSKPNIQQVSKNQKVEGYSPRIREVYIPHKKGAVIVSMDFMAQELRVIADYSRDENMLSCFIGDNLKDMHALTGLGIFNSRTNLGWSYETFVEVLSDKTSEFYVEVKKLRQLGKLTNFTTEFGAAAPKLAQTIMVSEGEAQSFIEAKEAAFPAVLEWKAREVAKAKACGFVRTKLGAKRHLRDAFLSHDRYVSSKAERQAVNTEVQGSSAEMTKLAEGRMWDAQLTRRFDCEIIGPIHDEVVASVMIEDLYDFIPAMHACMEQPYADMYVPVKSSISFGKTFGPAHQIEIGDKPTKEAIDQGLAEMREREEAVC